MTLYHEVYLGAFVVNVITAFWVIFLERRNVESTLAWLSVLLFFPILGFILYLAIGRNLSKRKLYRLKPIPERFIEQLAHEQKQALLDGSIAFSNPTLHKYKNLLFMNLASSHAFFTEDNQVQVYAEGMRKFESLFLDIEQATQSVHLQYYIIKNDRLGNRLLQLLVECAKKGVEVRVLYDALGSMELPKRFFRPLLDAGGEAYPFFPAWIPYLNLRMNYRNHRKVAVIDGRTAYVGGFNVGDEYLGLDPNFGPWRDTHLRIQGSASVQLQALFLLDWNVASPNKTIGDTRHYPETSSAGNTGLQVVSSGPDSPTEQVRNAYLRMIHAAQDYVDVQTPYFIPDESLLTALKTASYSGVKVRVMIPAKPDHKLVYWASMYYVGELLSAGVEFYLYEKGFLHSKTIIVDGDIASVGTANIDIRSFRLNFEVNALIYDPSVVLHLVNLYNADLEVCRRLTQKAYQARPRLHRFRESMARLLSPIL